MTWTMAGQRKENGKTIVGMTIEGGVAQVGGAPRKNGLKLARQSCFWSELDHQWTLHRLLGVRAVSRQPCIKELSCGGGPRKKKGKGLSRLVSTLVEGEVVIGASKCRMKVRDGD